MSCPICNQEVRQSDHSEQWGPEFSHSRCVVAFSAGMAVQEIKMMDRIKRLEEACREIVSEEDTYIRLQTWLKAKEAKL